MAKYIKKTIRIIMYLGIMGLIGLGIYIRFGGLKEFCLWVIKGIGVLTVIMVFCWAFDD